MLFHSFCQAIYKTIIKKHNNPVYGIYMEVCISFGDNLVIEEDCLTAKVLIEHWEEKIIAYADAEDEVFYQELLEEGYIPKKDLYMLMWERDLPRQILSYIKEQTNEQNKVTEENIQELYSLLVINDFHHKGEENTLFPNQLSKKWS